MLKKRRFSEILKQLNNKSVNILDIALEAGYSSHEAFTRAFKSYYGMTPKQYRLSPELKKFLLLEPYNVSDIKFSNEQLCDPVIEKYSSIELKGITGNCSLNPISIDKLWNEYRNVTNESTTGAGYTVWMESDLEVDDLLEEVAYKCFVGTKSHRLVS